MIVELKKIKITSSIIKQLLLANWIQIESYKVLGWVLWNGTKGKKYKKILLYHEGVNTLVWFPYPNTVEIRDTLGGEAGKLRVVTISEIGIVDFTFKTEDETQLHYSRIAKQLLNEAKVKGQIFY